MASEYAPKIRFNCVAPSLTETPLSKSIGSLYSKTPHEKDWPGK